MLKQWYYIPDISSYEVLLFHNVICNYCDYCHYLPFAIAKEAQYGIKYRFLCIAYPDASPILCSDLMIIEIYKPIHGAPYMTNIRKICIDVFD